MTCVFDKVAMARSPLPAMLSSAVRDADDRPIDFRIIDCNEAAARLLRVPENELRWQRLRKAARGLFAGRILDRFLDC